MKQEGEQGHAEGEDLGLSRSEEEVGTDTRIRDAGSLNVRKSVRTECERVRVQKRREEIEIERSAMNLESPGAEISAPGDEEEIVIRVYVEEVVVSKKVVLKEEIRIRKKVVEETEVVEVDLRKEEVDIDDMTERGSNTDGGDVS